MPTFRRYILSPSSGLKMEIVCWHLSTSSHGAKTQDIIILIAMETSNLTYISHGHNGRINYILDEYEGNKSSIFNINEVNDGRALPKLVILFSR
jgi:hypothetical protein